MHGIQISWVEIGGAIAALAGTVAFLFRHIQSTNKTRIDSYKQVVDELNAAVREKDKKIEELYNRLTEKKED